MKIKGGRHYLKLTERKGFNWIGKKQKASLSLPSLS